MIAFQIIVNKLRHKQNTVDTMLLGCRNNWQTSRCILPVSSLRFICLLVMKRQVEPNIFLLQFVLMICNEKDLAWTFN
jgi:hypothetical protein